MASSSLTDPFHFCFSALCDESKKFNDVFFSNDDCLIEDTREADFTKIENRLAYMYKFGYINSVLVEKCALAFFDQYFQGDKNYFSGNLKICSLSNGPGIDIVGFLCALYKSNKLKFSPLLHAVNLHDFWKDIFHNLICSVYLDYNSKCNETHTVIPPENIQFIQCDIFSSLSPQAQNFISTCDILLMVKVFISAKAPQILTERLQEIFSLLRPGALVFFFGSKNNIKEIMKDHVKKYVNYLFGPKLMDLEKLSTDENVPEIHPLKPKVCSKVRFIVLQKKNVSKETDATSQNVTKSAPSSTVLSPNMTVVNDSEEESDTDSEISSTSNTRPSDTLSMHSQHLSHENKLGFLNMASKSLSDADSSDEKKQSLNLPIESTSLSENTLSFEKINTEPVSNMARVDTVIKESLAGAFTLTDLPELDKLASHEGIAEKSVSTDSKQSSQLSDFDEVQSPDLSGEVKSVVLQQKDVAKETDMDSPQSVSKLKKPRRRQKKNKSTIDEPNFDELSVQMISFSDSEEDSDTDSKISSTSNSKPSDTLSIYSQDLSHENKLGFSNMASESLNDADCADEKKQSLNLPIESTSLSENTLPFEKIITEPVSNIAQKDTSSKENLTEGFTLTDLPELDKLASHERIAEKSVSTDSKQSSQLEDFDEVQYPDLSGEVKSIELQERDVAKETDADSSQNVTKKNRRSKRKKNKTTTLIAPSFNQFSPNTATTFKEENYTNPEISHTSSIKLSDTFSIQSLHLSHENKFQSMASQSVNNTICAGDKKQTFNLLIESTSPSENALPFQKISAEPVSSMTKTDITSKESLTQELPLNKLPVFRKFLSHQGIAEKNVGIDSKQLSQLGDLGKVQSPNGARSVVMGMTSKKKLDRTETIASKQIQPPHNLPHEDLFQSPKMTACKEMGMQDTSNDRNKLTEVSRKEGCSSQMSCSTYNGAERDTKSLNAAKQPRLAAQRQFQPDIKNTVSEHFVGVRSSNDLHSMLQRCENVVTSLERAVACISTNMQSLQSSQVPMGECCSGYVGSAFRNLHCCNHCDNFSVQSCSRKNRCCVRTQTNVGVAHSNCVCCAERINDTRLCHSDTNPKPYFVIPVQNEILPHVLSFISKKT